MRLNIETWRLDLISITLAIFLCGTFGSAAIAEMLNDAERFAFVHASVIPMDTEHVLLDQTVIISAGRIEAVGSYDATEIPEGVKQIDVTGQYLIPAFCDMHVHLLGDVWNMFLPPEAKIPVGDLDMAPFLFPYLANGVTTVQVLSATQDHIDLRKKIEQGEILGPRLLLASMIDGPDRAWPPPLSTWVASPSEARQAVLAAGAAGYDAMKVYSFLSSESYEAIITTAKEIDMDVIGHIPLSLSLDQVLNMGQHLIVHSEEVIRQADGDYSQERITQLADMVVSSDTWLMPTLVTTRNIIAIFDDLEGALSRPEARYFQHPMQQGVWSFIIQQLYAPISEPQRQHIRDSFEQFQVPFTRALNARGAKLLAGSDSLIPTLVPGFALHRELEELVGAGLSPYEALRTSTTYPFEYLGENDNAGTIHIGKQANLVLLKENPLLDITNSRKISGVVVQGKWLAGEQIKKGLDALATSQESPNSAENQ